jgi:phosphatidylglycerol---prolipoprotein diacylglyceryl transferase
MKPVLLSLGNIPIYSFGFMVAMGLLLALYLMTRRARLDGFPQENEVFDLVFVVVLSGFLSARLHYVLQNLSFYAQRPLHIFAIWEGGLIFYGGMIGAFIGILIFMKIKSIPPTKGFDFLLPYVSLTHAFGRIGCFLNGCCFGKACDLPWAIKFPESAVPVHPTQIYEALFDVALFLFLNARYNKKRFDGEIMCLYFMIYAIGRFAIELVRENPTVFSLTYNQWISIATFLVACLAYAFLSKRKTLKA